jgi:hypothetical protein
LPWRAEQDRDAAGGIRHQALRVAVGVFHVQSRVRSAEEADNFCGIFRVGNRSLLGIQKS